MQMQMEEEEEEPKLVPIDQQVDVPERGRRPQKYRGAAAIPGPIATTSAPTIMRAKAKTRVEGFEIPDDSDGYGGAYFCFIFISFDCLYGWSMY